MAKWCELGKHNVPALWKSNPPACKHCWSAYKYKESKKATESKPTLVHKSKYGLTYGEPKASAELGIWFEEQISIMPKECENCGDYLNPYMPWGARAYVCHILPKRTFKSVMLHPKNRWFGCIDCHTNYDNNRNVEEMKVFPIILERYFAFKDEILENNKIPPFLSIYSR